MKNLALSFLFIFSISLYPQVATQKIFEKTYEQLPFKIRVENSGIYGVAMFNVEKDLVTISSYDQQNVFQFSNNQFLSKKGFDECRADLKPEISKINNLCSNYYTVVENRNRLSVYSADNAAFIMALVFNNNLAYADVIGTDNANNFYLIVEKYAGSTGFNINRQVYTVSAGGKVLSILEIPCVKYLSTVRDFQVDKDGSLYHLYSDTEKIAIYKWTGLSSPSASIIKYPFEYDHNFNINKYLPVDEPKAEENAVKRDIQASTSRLTALRTGDTYVLHRYTTQSQNLAPNTVTGPDGDLVQTPTWVVNGINAKIPYMWGGFNTLSQFDAGLKSGRYAGDINTKGVSNYAVGVDCSGFVSRCWQLSYHSTTSDMPSITTQLSSWDVIKPADAVLKNGHVRMFVEKNTNGSLRVVESSGRDWGVSYWTYTPSDLTAYAPCSYNNMVSDYSLKRPDLLSATLLNTNGNGTVRLTWKCDTAGVVGYRIYKSTDGANFTQVQDETTVKTTSTNIPMTSKAEYYRVSSIILSSTNAAVESNWSAVMGVSNFNSQKKALVIDGYERLDGTWRGPGNPFLYNYGKALENNSINFEMTAASKLRDSTLLLKDYGYVYWLLEDESTATESFSSAEQTMVKNYLESGGSLFTSGSEIGFDLSGRGTAADRTFYANYMKASYIDDNSNSNSVVATDSSIIKGYSFNIAQTIAIGYPDIIASFGGSTLCMQYANGKGAGIQYEGKFGTSDKTGRIVYLGFPLESTADDSCFNGVITKTLAFFNGVLSGVNSHTTVPCGFSLKQNYPNPFNPSTTIAYTISNREKVSLKVYDVLGKEIATLVNEVKPAGSYSVIFDGRLASGIYFYRLQAGSFSDVKRMVLLK